MKLAIVDKETEEAERLKKMLEEGLAERMVICDSIDCSFSGEEFLEHYRMGEYELLFLDASMPGLNGLEIAKRLRQDGDSVPLVLCSESNGFAAESYEVNASYYLKKPVQPEKVRAMLENLNLKLLERRRVLFFPDGKPYLVRKILYTNYFQRWVTFVTDEGEKEFRITHSEVTNLLREYPNFLSIGQSNLVNLDRVQELTKEGFLMDNGVLMAIPRRLHKTAREAYMHYSFRKTMRQERA